MTCDQYRELISADFDGELEPLEEVELFGHLAACADCRLWRRGQVEIRAEFIRWPEEEFAPSKELPRAVDVRQTRTYRVPRTLAWAAGLLFVAQSTLTITTMLLGRGEDSDQVRTPGTVETISLTPADCTSFTVSSSRQIPKPTVENPKGG